MWGGGGGGTARPHSDYSLLGGSGGDAATSTQQHSILVARLRFKRTDDCSTCTHNGHASCPQFVTSDPRTHNLSND